MIKKTLIVLNLFVLYQFHSQIKMELTLDYLNKKANVILINESDTNLVIPMDTLSLRPYFNNICLDITEYTYNYPTLGLNIKVMQNNEIIESSATGGKINDLTDLKKDLRKLNLQKKKFERNVKLWQKKNNIKSFEEAKINYYIFNNLIYLKPGERIKKVFYFDLHNITNEKYMYYYYHIKDDEQYTVSLSFNANQCLYKYLTKTQKDKLTGYKLFNGEIDSNKIELEQ